MRVEGCEQTPRNPGAGLTATSAEDQAKDKTAARHRAASHRTPPPQLPLRVPQVTFPVSLYL